MIFSTEKISKRTVDSVSVFYLLVLIKLILLKYPAGLANTLDFYTSFRISHNVVPPNLIPFKTIYNLIQEPLNWYVCQNILGNIIIFTPLGILIPVLFPYISGRKIIATAFSISLLLESIQLETGLGIFDVNDVLLNTLGALVGLFIYKSSTRREY